MENGVLINVNRLCGLFPDCRRGETRKGSIDSPKVSDLSESLGESQDLGEDALPESVDAPNIHDYDGT